MDFPLRAWTWTMRRSISGAEALFIASRKSGPLRALLPPERLLIRGASGDDATVWVR